MADVRLATGYGELKQASDRLRKVLYSQGILVTHPVMTAINARVLRPIWLDDADWREQVEEAFKRGVSVSLIARPDARGDLKLAILGLAVEPVELGFLQVYPQVEGVQRQPRGFAMRLRVREAVQ